MKVFVNRKYVDGPWGGGNGFVKNIFNYASSFGYVATNQLGEDVDIIHMQDVHADELGIGVDEVLSYKEKINPRVKIIHRVNDFCWHTHLIFHQCIDIRDGGTTAAQQNAIYVAKFRG